MVAAAGCGAGHTLAVSEQAGITRVYAVCGEAVCFQRRRAAHTGLTLRPRSRRLVKCGRLGGDNRISRLIGCGAYLHVVKGHVFAVDHLEQLRAPMSCTARCSLGATTHTR